MSEPAQIHGQTERGHDQEITPVSPLFRVVSPGLCQEGDDNRREQQIQKPPGQRKGPKSSAYQQVGEEKGQGCESALQAAQSV